MSQNEHNTSRRGQVGDHGKNIIELRLPCLSELLASKQVLLDLASFLLSLVLAYMFGWRAGDLVWSLWLSSLALGCAVYLVWIFNAAWHDLPSWFRAMPLASRIMAPFSTLVRLVLPLTLLFALFYIGAHLFYSVFLNQSLPVIGGKPNPSWEMYREILYNYWPFLPIAFLREHRAFFSIFRRKKNDEKEPDMQASFWAERFKGLIKTHILIFVLAFLPFGGSSSFFAYVAVSAVYFFPWELFVKPVNKTKPTLAETLTTAKKMADEQVARDAQQHVRSRKRNKH